jgi:hypothetical protein
MTTSGGQGQAWRQTQVRVSDERSSEPEERLFKVVVTSGRNVMVLKILLSVEDNRFCLHFPVFNIHFVATQHNGGVLTNWKAISVPAGHVLSNS